jgi:hypothetical protein
MALENFMENWIGTDYCTLLGWSTGAGSFDFAVSETLRKLGLTVEPATLTDEILAVGKYMIWDCVVIALKGKLMDFSADGSSYKPSQKLIGAIQERKSAAKEANSYLGYTVVKHRIHSMRGSL